MVVGVDRDGSAQDQRSLASRASGRLSRPSPASASCHHRAALSWSQSPCAGARAQRPFQALGVREPLGRILGQAPQHDTLQVLGDIGAAPRGWHHRLAGVRHHHPDPRPPVERRPAGQQEVGHRPQRVDVAAGVDSYAPSPAPATCTAACRGSPLLGQMRRLRSSPRAGPGRSRAAWPRRAGRRARPR